MTGDHEGASEHLAVVDALEAPNLQPLRWVEPVHDAGMLGGETKLRDRVERIGHGVSYGRAMRLDLLRVDQGEEGELLRVALGAGNLEATVQVEEGIFGRKVTVTVAGKDHVIDLDD
jgi:hypothetical protein